MNAFSAGTIRLSFAFLIQGKRLYHDLNKDGIVNIRDVTIVALAFGSKPGDENWNPITDLNNDEVISIRDVTAVALDFGKTA